MCSLVFVGYTYRRRAEAWAVLEGVEDGEFDVADWI